MLCEKARRIRDDFCAEIKEKCKKVEMHNKNAEEAHVMIDNIKGHCNNALAGQTRQRNVEYDEIFQGLIIKKWFSE